MFLSYDLKPLSLDPSAPPFEFWKKFVRYQVAVIFAVVHPRVQSVHVDDISNSFLIVYATMSLASVIATKTVIDLRESMKLFPRTTATCVIQDLKETKQEWSKTVKNAMEVCKKELRKAFERQARMGGKFSSVNSSLSIARDESPKVSHPPTR